MEFAEILLQLIVGSPIIVGTLNIAGLTEIGVNFISKFKTAPPPEELLYSLFFNVGYGSLVETAKKNSLLNALGIVARKKKIDKTKIFISVEELKHVFQGMPHKNEDNISIYFNYFFSEVQRWLKDADSKILDAETVDRLINSAKEKVLDNWESKLSSVCEQYPQLKGYIDNKRFDQMGLMFTGESIPRPVCGADAHYNQDLEHDEEFPYLEQYILFSNEKGNKLNARPMEQSRNWWDKLSEQLGQAPVFLTGPGGMGKTTFLKFLYNSIRTSDKDDGKIPFSCAFLLSLDTLMRQENIHIVWDVPVLECASESILLQWIDLLANSKKQTEGWKSVFKHSPGFPFDRPVLLLLDGFNEMRGLRTSRRNRLYNRILQEIIALSSMQKFSNLRIIVTSRIDRENLLEDQMKELEGFQHAELQGIHLSPDEEAMIQGYETRHQEIRILLERPMYYLAVFDANEGITRFSTQFELLEIMYDRLCQQGIANLGVKLSSEPYQYLMKYFIPIIAYNDWKGQIQLAKDDDKVIDQLRSWIPMVAADSETYTAEVKAQLSRTFEETDQVIRYLQETVQILYLKDGQFHFRHQDYRDYLVAKYFLRRREHMKREPYAEQWTQKGVMDSLSLNTYSTDIIRLIYQALSFTDPERPEKYIEGFQIENWAFAYNNIPPGYILWYTTAYQLCDMCGLEGVKYAGTDLSEDTLEIMRPLLQCVEREVKPERPPDLLLQNLIETLMKCCELYRAKNDYQQARNVVQAARYFLEKDTELSVLMRYVVEYNDFKLDMAEFLGGNQEIVLVDTLKKLERSACQGTPFRYACNTLGMLLVSPHPAIKEIPEFIQFRDELLRGQAPEVQAFWLHYAAVFDPRKKGEDWLPRMYSLRQMLYLLAENKVAVSDMPLDMLRQIDLRMLKEWCGTHVVIPDINRAIPGSENLILIERFLDKIEGVPEEKKGWMHYLQALVDWRLEKGDTYEDSVSKAIGSLEKADRKDVRTQLLLAFLQGRDQELPLIYEKHRPQGGNLPAEIGGYSVSAYYSRDIGRVYNTLLGMRPI